MGKIGKIVSGGQTGADIGGLDAAIHCGIPHGGWCPKGRRQEYGMHIPQEYQLQEMDSPEYLKRTEANVVDSDATVIFTYGPLTGGSAQTREFCVMYGKPVLCLDLQEEGRDGAARAVVAWLESSPGIPDGCVLNVAGSRGSNAPGIDQDVKSILIDVIGQVNGDEGGGD